MILQCVCAPWLNDCLKGRDGLGSDIAVVAGPSAGADIANTKVRVRLVRVVDDGQDGEGMVDAELRAVAPRDAVGRAGRARDVVPALGRRAGSGRADDGALFVGTAAGAEGKVVVAASVLRAAETVEALDRPSCALDDGGCLNRWGNWGGSGCGLGCSAQVGIGEVGGWA